MNLLLLYVYYVLVSFIFNDVHTIIYLGSGHQWISILYCDTSIKNILLLLKHNNNFFYLL